MNKKHEPDFVIDESIIDEIKAPNIKQINYCEECGSENVEYTTSECIVTCKKCGYINKDPLQIVI